MTHRLCLLPLEPAEIVVVLDAVNAFAIAEEAEGDPCCVGPLCDEVADRLRGFAKVTSVDAVEKLRAWGIGTYKNRPQG
jgi:hypothetical protein